VPELFTVSLCASLQFFAHTMELLTALLVGPCGRLSRWGDWKRGNGKRGTGKCGTKSHGWKSQDRKTREHHVYG